MEGQIKCFPDKVKLKEFIITKPLTTGNVKGTYLRNRRGSITMNSKVTTNSQLSRREPKKKNKLSKQLEEEQNHRNRDHMEGFQW